MLATWQSLYVGYPPYEYPYLLLPLNQFFVQSLLMVQSNDRTPPEKRTEVAVECTYIGLTSQTLVTCPDHSLNS